jgi:hypothetical protein
MGAPLYDAAALARRRAVEHLAAQTKVAELIALAKATKGQPVPEGEPLGLQIEAIPPEILAPLLPRLRADAVPIDNRAFLRAIFGGENAVHLCGFPNDPGDAGTGKWRGYRTPALTPRRRRPTQTRTTRPRAFPSMASPDQKRKRWPCMS